jgi:guanylate kinase
MEASTTQKPQLVHLDEFRQLLDGYKPSQKSIEILCATQTVFIVGPTASGRNTLIDELEKSGKYHFLLSDTTRPPRMHNGALEKNGQYYWHISEEEFLDGLQQGKYLEAAIIHEQQVSGTNADEIAKADTEGKIAITDIEGLSGAVKMHQFNPGSHFVFVLPPPFTEWLERLHKRGAITFDEVKGRMRTAVQEIEAALNHDYYYFIISGDLAQNTAAVDEYIHGPARLEIDQTHAKAYAQELLADIRSYLAD